MFPFSYVDFYISVIAQVSSPCSRRQIYGLFDIFFCFCLQQPELLKLKEEMSRINAKIKKSEKELARKEQERRRHKEDVKELQKGIQDLTAKLEDLHEKARDSGDKLKLDDTELREYFRM